MKLTLEPKLFAQFLPKLRSETALTFWLIMPESALKAFQASGWDVLPPQKASSRNANLGNWQLSSSASKQLSFYAWCSNRAEQLGDEKAYLLSMEVDVPAFAKAVQSLQLGSTVSLDHRGSDCQLALWGKLAEGASQPSLKELQIEVSAYVFQLEPFNSIKGLFETNTFDWGGASSARQLSQHWRLDAQQHRHVCAKLVQELGEDSALGQLIAKELQQPASVEEPKESPALVAFWKQTSKVLHRSLRDTLQNVEQLIEQQQREAFWDEAWEPEQAEAEAAAAAAASAASGRVDGSDNSLQSGSGNLPLNLKLELARALGSFKP